MTPSLTVELLRLNPEADADLALPRYMTRHAAGLDIVAAVKKEQVIKPGRICLVPTGFAMALPDGCEAQIRPRSGLAVRHGVTIVNAPGTIDADYRGEVKVALINLGREPFRLLRGQRIAQMVIQRISRVRIQPVDRLSQTERSDGGFGSTGR